jgi:hypothetical protein
MKLHKYIPAFALLAVSAAAMVGCTEDPELPPMIVPEAPHLKDVNTTILDLKTAYWSTERNYVNTVDVTEDGSHIYIKGRVVSSDESGNIYKSVIISDGTASLTLAINATKLYQTYQFGQELVIDLTGMKLGGYNGLMQLGGEGTYNGAPSMTFMEQSEFAAHAEQNGLSNPAKVDTLVTTVADVLAAKETPEGLISWQSRLVKIVDVSFVDAGQPFAGETTTNRYVTDAYGNRLNVRNSSYASFAKDLLPSGTGSVVGILSYYGTDWQLLLIDRNGCIGFESDEKPDVPADGGTKEDPYTVDQVLTLGNPGTTAWVKGYIVGSVPGKAYEETVFGTENASATNLVLAATADETDHTKCIPVQLPVGDVRAALNLQANPVNLGKEVMLNGSLEQYFGVPALKTVTSYIIDGQEGGQPDTPVGPVDPVSSLNATFEGVTAISQLPGWSLQNVKGNKPWYFTSFQENSYAAITGYKGTSTEGYESWLITPPLNFDAMAKKVLSFQSQAAYTGADKLEVFVMTTADPSTATLSALECHIAEPPASGYSGFETSGEISLESFSGVGYIGFRYTAPAGASGYRTYCIDNVVAGQDGQGGETPDPDEPDTPVTGGAGSEESPYTVADVVALNNPADKPVAWVEGYIVGSAPGKAASSFVTETGAGASATNLFIADSADQTDYNKCLPVQLPAGAVRDALNLQANPDNLGKKVKLSGTLEKYFGLPGLKSVSQYTVL